MKLNLEQQNVLSGLSEVVGEMDALRERYRKELTFDLRRLKVRLREVLRDAEAKGVPKRQMQVVSGIKSSATFYALLREAGVQVAPKPEGLRLERIVEVDE